MPQLWCQEHFPVCHSFFLDVLIQVHHMISIFCNTRGLCIGIRNIRADGLYKDGLHLLDKGKIVLGNNFIINLNQNFLTTHTHTIHQMFFESGMYFKAY